jgi:SAM-dependent methyltransferase
MKELAIEETPNITESASSYYDADYFNWQKNIGAFGGWANAFKFKNTVRPADTVIDFGCGGGFLLHNLNCATRIGIEPNPSAAESVRKFGIKHFTSPSEALRELGGEVADVIISNHALEHTLNPLQEIKSLRPLLKRGGTIHFYVPCEAISLRYDPNNINYHLFSWSPQNLGNLLTEAGYKVEYSKACIHKWPPFYTKIARLGWPVFNAACRIYGRLERTWFQVEAKAIRPND